jgi:uncharacterized membrane protein
MTAEPTSIIAGLLAAWFLVGVIVILAAAATGLLLVVIAWAWGRIR